MIWIGFGHPDRDYCIVYGAVLLLTFKLIFNVFDFFSLLIELLETLNDHLLCFPIDEDSKIRKQLLDFTTNLMTRSGSTKIQSQARTLMASLFASKNDFFDWKVQILSIL